MQVSHPCSFTMHMLMDVIMSIHIGPHYAMDSMDKTEIDAIALRTIGTPQPIPSFHTQQADITMPYLTLSSSQHLIPSSLM